MMLRYIPSIPNYLKAFYPEVVLDLIKGFTASIEMIKLFLTLLLLMCCITFIHLHMLNHPCIPALKPFGFGCCSPVQEMSFVDHYLPYFRQWLITYLLSAFLPFLFIEGLHGD
jgi:hypothetical protein